jgi:[citrate (pro-3S)-lyase] ligase
MELDVILFASKIAPFFGIGQRFVGTEPNDPLTGAYNEAMRRLLPEYGIALTVVERARNAAGAIRASRVRELIGWGDFAALAEHVPATTLAWLESDAAGPVHERLGRFRKP